MRNAIFQFEFRHWLKSPMLYLFLVCFFLFSLVTMLGTGGYFDGPATAGENVSLLNTPYELTFISLLFSKFLLLIVAIVAGNGLARDYKNNTHALLYAYPIQKKAYLNGKLGSGIGIILISAIITLMGVLIGELMLGTANPKIGAFNLMGYLTAMGIYLIPTLITIGIFVFTVVGVTRNIFAGFITVIVFVLFQMIVENVFFNNHSLLALLDPFGQNAFQIATKEWDFNTKNSTLIPVNYLVVLNRVVWFALAFAALGMFYKKFDFQYDPLWNPTKKKRATQKAKSIPTIQSQNKSITYNYSTKANWSALVRLIRFDFYSILKNWMFLLLTGFGILTLFFIQFRVTNTGAFNLLPRTRIMLGAPLQFYVLIMIMGTFLFSGILVQKAKQYSMATLIDVTPIKNWQLITSKVCAITLLQIFQLVLFLLLSVGIQVFNGYYQFEFGLYLIHLFIFTLPILIVWNITAVFVHSLLPNIFLGLFTLLGLWLSAQGMEQLGIHSHLAKFNTLPNLEYSDFSGYGYQLRGYLLLLLYWIIFGLLIFASTWLVWNRGTLSTIKERYRVGKMRVNKYLSGILLLLALNVGWVGHHIYSAEKVDQQSALLQNENVLENYKKEWSPYIELPQPKINSIFLELDIYPNKNRFVAKGKYVLINSTKKAIDTLFIRTGFDEHTSITWQENADLIKSDSVMKTALYKLAKTLQPQGSIVFNFEAHSIPNTIFTKNSSVLSNGSFIQQDILPRIGYQFRESEPDHEHSLCNHNFYYQDADLINLHTKISTQQGQMAFAPGKLLSQKKDGNRNVFEYKTPNPVKLNFSFHSGKFEHASEKHNDVDIDIYYQKGHEQNVNAMFDGIKASLTYNTKKLGPYPYDQIRVVEFPRTEATYAGTLVTNNIIASEMLFTNNTEVTSDKLNLPFYVMAHEVTHEWFGNQVMPADAAGAKMLSESLTEYITSCIYRTYLGEDIANEFLQIQQNRYQRGSKKEKGIEPPLYQVKSDQQYIAYGKGAIHLNHLAKVIGEEKMINILTTFLNEYKGAPECYPISENFIDIILKQVDSTHHQLVNELFKTTKYFEVKLDK